MHAQGSALVAAMHAAQACSAQAGAWLVAQPFLQCVLSPPVHKQGNPRHILLCHGSSFLCFTAAASRSCVVSGR